MTRDPSHIHGRRKRTSGARTRCWSAALGLLAMLSMSPLSFSQEGDQSSATDISVEELIWGFDNQAVAGMFMPLSVRILNHEARPVSGTLRLTRRTLFNKAVGVPIESSFNAGPFEERWVQLIPLIMDDSDTWSLSWGDRQIDVPAFRLGDRAAVLLTNRGELKRIGGAVRRFPAELFPATVAATDALEAVVLDAIPDLQGARLQTLRDWLSRGGRLFVLHDDTDRFPIFPEALKELNLAEERFEFGSGVVRRLPVRSSEIDLATMSDIIRVHPPQRQTAKRADAPAGDRLTWERDRPLLEELDAWSRFKRRWWLIYPVALLYLACIFPGCYVVGRQVAAAGWFYLAFLGSAALFSLAFMTLGQVGAGEHNHERSASIAWRLDSGLYDVSQWSSFAAIRGDRYFIRHTGSGRLYAAGLDVETVQGVSRSGPEAELEIEIAPGGVRPVVSRRRTTGPDVALAIRTAVVADGRLQALELNAPDWDTRLVSAHVAYGDGIYRLKANGASLTLASPQSITTRAFISASAAFTFSPIGLPIEDESDPDLDWTLSQINRRLVGNAFGLSGPVPGSVSVPAGLARVLLQVRESDAFAAEGRFFPDRDGCVLFVIDLPVTDR